MEHVYCFPEIGFRALGLSGAAALIMLPHVYYLANRVLAS